MQDHSLVSITTDAIPVNSNSSQQPDWRRLAKQIEKEHSAVQAGLASTLLAAFRAGGLLLNAKQQVNHKQWLQWLQNSFGAGSSTVSVRMCQRYMQVAQRLEALPEFSSAGDMNGAATRASQVRRLEELEIRSIRQLLKPSGLSNHAHVIDAIDAEEAVTTTSESRQQAAEPNLREIDFDVTEVASPSTPERSDPPSPILIESQCAADDYLTPTILLRPILECFANRIDLDPCASLSTTFQIPATKSLTITDDGLSVAWHGRVYVHPPQTAVLEWINKAVEEFRAGHADEVILLVQAITDADFNGPIQPFPRAYLRDRPRFATPDGATTDANVPYMLVFLGPESRFEVFADAAGGFGDVYFAYRFV